MNAKIIKIPYKPHKKQLEFHNSKAKFRAFIGGVGSGKTVAGVNEAIKQAILNQGSLGAIIAPTYPMLRDATQRTFFEFCPDELIEDFLKAENRLKLVNGSEIIFRSADNPRNIERLRGTNLAWFYIDEAALVDRLAWKILIGRLRQKNFELKAWITTTPKGYNWIYEEFIENQREGYEVIHCTSLDNPYLPKEYVEDLEKSYSGVFYKQEVLGEFVGYEGLVYPEFSRNIHVGDFSSKTFKDCIAGVDFGYTNPSVILVIGIDSDNRMYVVEEFYQRRIMIDELISYAKQLKQKYNISTFYCDPSEPMFIEQFNRSGMHAVPGNNDVIPGIQAVAARLKNKTLFVDRSCVNTIAEFENYRYPERKEGKAEQEKPLKVFDHAMDALRYAVMGMEQPKLLKFYGALS